MSNAYLSSQRRSFIPETLADIEQVIRQVIQGNDDTVVPSEGRQNETLERDSFAASVATVLATQESRNSPNQHEVVDSSARASSNTPMLTPSNSFPKSIGSSKHEEPSLTKNSQEGMLIGASSFNLSLMSDTSEDDDDCNLSSLGCLDRILCSRYTTQNPSARPSQNIGLGITGMTRKNEQVPFDGLGLVYLPSFSRKDSSHLGAKISAYEGYSEITGPSLISDESSDTLSETFLQEALLTFLEDPFHSQNVNSIPECKSWYELETVSQFSPPNYPEPSSERYRSARYHSSCHGVPPKLGDGQSPTKLKKHYSSATISSKLKRNDRVNSASAPTSRGRSASWPTTSNSPSFREKNYNRHDRLIPPISRSAWKI